MLTLVLQLQDFSSVLCKTLETQETPNGSICLMSLEKYFMGWLLVEITQHILRRKMEVLGRKTEEADFLPLQREKHSTLEQGSSGTNPFWEELTDARRAMGRG